MKQRTESYLRQHGRDWGEVKLGEGSIRDVEFVVQYLQLAHGRRQPELRTGHTLEALRRLHAYGLLPAEDQRTLMDGYIFLRTIEHHLQMMHYRQTQTLPSDPTAQHDLARRLGFTGSDPAEPFLARYQEHTTAIRELYFKYMSTGATLARSGPLRRAGRIRPTKKPPTVLRHVARMDPSYSATFSAHDIRRHATLANQLGSEHLAFVDANSLEDGRWRVTVVAYDYPGELVADLRPDVLLRAGYSGRERLHLRAGQRRPAVPSRPTAGRKIVDVFTVRPAQLELAEDHLEPLRRRSDRLAAPGAGPPAAQDARLQLAAARRSGHERD